jgi:hypothetical protein
MDNIEYLWSEKSPEAPPPEPLCQRCGLLPASVDLFNDGIPTFCIQCMRRLSEYPS